MSPREGSLPERTDVVVVGGGIVGTSTAYWLAAEEERDVVLVEQGNIASGSTGDSSAILRHHYGDRPTYSRMAWWSHQFYREFEERTGSPLTHEEHPRVSFGREGEESGRYAQGGYEVLADLGIPVTRYGASELPEQYPMLDLDYDFAVSDDAAAFADGTDAATGLARAAADAGATVQTGVRVDGIDTEADAVTGVRTEADAVTGVRTEAGPIACDGVVIAAGPWTPRLLGSVEAVDVQIPLTVSREQVVILDPPPSYRESYPETLPTLSLPEQDWYARADIGGNVLVATHHTGDEVDPDTYRDSPDEGSILALTENLLSVVPELVDAGIAGRYCGLYTSTPDHDFVIDAVGPEGLAIGCGFSGHGFKHGPAIGRLLADLVLEGETDRFDTTGFSASRFENTVEGPGETHL